MNGNNIRVEENKMNEQNINKEKEAYLESLGIPNESSQEQNENTMILSQEAQQRIKQEVKVKTYKRKDAGFMDAWFLGLVVLIVEPILMVLTYLLIK